MLDLMAEKTCNYLNSTEKICSYLNFTEKICNYLDSTEIHILQYVYFLQHKKTIDWKNFDGQKVSSSFQATFSSRLFTY
jgi:hypothetical protein